MVESVLIAEKGILVDTNKKKDDDGKEEEKESCGHREQETPLPPKMP